MFPECLHRKIDETANPRRGVTSALVDHMDGQWRHFEVGQDDFQLTSRYFSRNLIRQDSCETQAEAGSGDGRLIRRDHQPWFRPDTQGLAVNEEWPAS